MGQLHGGYGGALSRPEIAALRQAEVAREREAVLAWLGDFPAAPEIVAWAAGESPYPRRETARWPAYRSRAEGRLARLSAYLKPGSGDAWDGLRAPWRPVEGWCDACGRETPDEQRRLGWPVLLDGAPTCAHCHPEGRCLYGHPRAPGSSACTYGH